MEWGEIILIGVIMENLFFELNVVFLLWCKVFVLRVFDKGVLVKILYWVLYYLNGFVDLEIMVEDGVLEVIVNFVNGDVWMVFNILEMVVLNG